MAVKHYLADAQAPAAERVAAALSWRLAPPENSDEAMALLGRELVPLYLHYIEDNWTRLMSVGRSDLADRFEHWRARILG